MPPDIHYDPKHHAGGTPEERIRNRLKNSGEGVSNRGGTVKTGDGPTRTITNIHPYGNVKRHGGGDEGMEGYR